MSQDGRSYMQYAGLAFQMGITIALATWRGRYIDQSYPSIAPAAVVICSLSGVGLALYSLIKTVLQDESTKNKGK